MNRRTDRDRPHLRDRIDALPVHGGRRAAARDEFDRADRAADRLVELVERIAALPGAVRVAMRMRRRGHG